MSGRHIQIGIIGCGNVLTAYGPAIQQLRARGLAEIVLACGRESQRSFVRSQLGDVRFTVDSGEVVGSSEVDLVMILTSMRQHGPLARVALEAGKHVFVEKPRPTGRGTTACDISSSASTMQRLRS